MKIQNSLLILIPFCSIQAYGMEKNKMTSDMSVTDALLSFTQQLVRSPFKDIARSKKKNINNSDIIKTKKLLWVDKKDLTLEEKNNLRKELEENNQILKDCYSEYETWSDDDWKQYHTRELLIGCMFPQIKNYYPEISEDSY